MATAVGADDWNSYFHAKLDPGVGFSDPLEGSVDQDVRILVAKVRQRIGNRKNGSGPGSVAADTEEQQNLAEEDEVLSDHPEKKCPSSELEKVGG